MSYRVYNSRPIEKFSPVNSLIIIINVIVFIILSLMGNTHSAQFMFNHGASHWAAVFYNHEYYRLLTCTFIHFGFSHLFNNMLVLGFIGDNLERALGKIKYIITYLVCAVGSSFLSCVWAWITGSPAVSGGASGAIFGVVGAMLVILIRNRGHLEDLSSRQVGLFAIFTIYHGITSAGVDNVAHVAGFALGALMGLLLYRKKKVYLDYSDFYN